MTALKTSRSLLYADLGWIMVNRVGIELCEAGYGTRDTALIGEAAIAYGDINWDGTLN